MGFGKKHQNNGKGKLLQKIVFLLLAFYDGMSKKMKEKKIIIDAIKVKNDF